MILLSLSFPGQPPLSVELATCSSFKNAEGEFAWVTLYMFTSLYSLMTAHDSYQNTPARILVMHCLQNNNAMFPPAAAYPNQKSTIHTIMENMDKNAIPQTSIILGLADGTVPVFVGFSIPGAL